MKKKTINQTRFMVFLKVPFLNSTFWGIVQFGTFFILLKLLILIRFEHGFKVDIKYKKWYNYSIANRRCLYAHSEIKFYFWLIYKLWKKFFLIQLIKI